MTAWRTRSYYPVFLDLSGRLCIVIGGGKVAERKAATLTRYQADVVVIAPEYTEEIGEMQADGQLTIEQRGYVRGDLEGAFVVVCATDSEEINRAVYAEAEEAHCLINVVDVPELCNFIVPSVVRRGGLQIAISTGGAAPVLAKRLRKRFQSEFGEEWGDYVALMGKVRAIVLARVPGGEAARKPIYERIADSDLLERLQRGETPSAEEIFEQFREAPAVEPSEESSGDEHVSDPDAAPEAATGTDPAAAAESEEPRG
jgi:precorrin-2 dehydrogenase / sirohydrochlorin ferrochelatase